MTSTRTKTIGNTLIQCLSISLVLAFPFASNVLASETKSSVNLIVIFIDDLGYADIGPFGENDFETPHLDQMAKEGMKFTDFVTSTAVCSASRAALLTGCYHRRVGISGALGPNSRLGINPNEVTIAEIAKQKNYATACFGKWHLGHHKPFLPLQHGFDHFYGLPYSNDMWPFHPDYADLPKQASKRKRGYPDLPLYEGNEISDPVVSGDDQKQLTTAYTERAVEFIDKNHEKPFFLYVPHSMVHVPLFVSEKFEGKSKAGLFGDVMMEIDWSVGKILDAVRKHELQNKTLVVFTSDNGPWLSYGNHAGSAAPLREGKGTMWEGGYRVPTLFWWPNRIAADTVCEELTSTIDLLPTFAKLISAKLPKHKIDGKNISPLFDSEKETVSPHPEFYLYYGNGQLQGVRDRQWKLMFPHKYRTMDGRPGGTDGRPANYSHLTTGTELYDLKNDISESKNVFKQHPDVVERLMKAAERARASLGDRLMDRQGTEIRPAHKLPPKKQNSENG